MAVPCGKLVLPLSPLSFPSPIILSYNLLLLHFFRRVTDRPLLPHNSLSLPQSLSLLLDLSFSLFADEQPRHDWQQQQPQWPHAPVDQLQRVSITLSQASRQPTCKKQNTILCPLSPPNKFTSTSLLKMVPSISNESARIFGTITS